MYALAIVLLKIVLFDGVLYALFYLASDVTFLKQEQRFTYSKSTIKIQEKYHILQNFRFHMKKIFSNVSIINFEHVTVFSNKRKVNSR